MSAQDIVTADWVIRPDPYDMKNATSDPGPNFLKRIVRSWQVQLSSIYFKNLRILIKNNTVIVYSNLSATVTGMLDSTLDYQFLSKRNQPFGDSFFSISSMEVHTIQDGKIARTMHVADWSKAVSQYNQGTAVPSLDFPFENIVGCTVCGINNSNNDTDESKI